jgi:hypothetical protein
MTDEKRGLRDAHRHRPVVTRVIVQRGGVPYEQERRSCADCGRELELRTIKRTAA